MRHVVKIWAFLSLALTGALILFLFGYIFYRGATAISPDFLFTAPSGAVLGEQGGIWPAIIGSLWFTGIAVFFGGVPAIATAIYAVFYCRRRWVTRMIQRVMRSIAGIPSILLGLFAYSFFVRGLGWGRCLLSGGMALAIMILPFVEVRVEKAFLELARPLVRSSDALGCAKAYTIRKIALPAARGEIVSALILGGCYAMGATAPLIFTGAVAYAALPVHWMRPAMALPMHLYLLVAQGETSMGRAYGTAFVMMALILIFNLCATLYGRRRHKKWMQS